MNPLLLSAQTIATGLGLSLSEHAACLKDENSALKPCDFMGETLPTYVATVDGLDSVDLPAHLQHFDCRNHRLALKALAQDNLQNAVENAKSRYGKKRIAVILGTTTSGILSGELAYREQVDKQLPANFSYENTVHPSALSRFVGDYFDVHGMSFTIGTACSSSAMAFGVASKMIDANVCDAVIVGGADSLCLTTLYGFSSLEVLSTQPCKPCDQQRDGLSLGEGAAFALLERPMNSGFGLLGYGESCDAYHVSTPHPQGLGAKLAMSNALVSAGIQPAEVDYISMHGTASLVNDAAEDKAIFELFADAVPCSSIKGLTGHTLGASGIVEAILMGLCIEDNLAPGSAGATKIDEHFQSQALLVNKKMDVNVVLSNSFGFGGNNCSLLLGKI